MKRTIYLVIALAVLCIAPVYAQGAFSDVPSEHWAYDAVESLQAKGILQGYPDGTFQGKRTMSRYELATVIARLLQQLPPAVDTSNLVTKDQLEALKNSIPAPSVPGVAPDLSNLATKDDVAAIRKLVDGFKDELQSLGVDVDQVKRDLSALTARVDAIEAEMRRVRFTGTFNVIAKTYSDNTPWINRNTTGAIITDQDGRHGNPTAAAGSSALRDMNVYRDFDLNLVGRVNETTTAMATINFGNYINYLNSGTAAGASDAFVPYYMCIASDLGFGQLTVGRFPLQLGAYTFKMPDVDSYVDLAKTDSGNRPVDGAMLKTGLLGIDWTWFAAQHEKVPSYTAYGTPVYGVPFTQSAGVQLGFNAPANIRLEGTYYQGWDKNNYKSSVNPDLMEVMGADIAIPLPFVKALTLSGDWAASRQKVDGKKLDLDDQALNYRLAAELGSVDLGVGWRDIGVDFAAPGAWDKFGFVNNPVNYKGLNADLAFNLGSKFKVNAGGEFAKVKRDGIITTSMGSLAKNDKVNKYFGGIDYAYSQNDSLGVGVDYIQVDQKSRLAGADMPTLTYVSVNWARKFSDNAKLKVEYQWVEFNNEVVCGTPNPSFQGSIGVVQLGVSF